MKPFEGITLANLKFQLVIDQTRRRICMHNATKVISDYLKYSFKN